MLPPLYARVLAARPDSVPADIRRQLCLYTKQNTRRNDAALAEVRAFVRACATSGVRVLPLRLPALVAGLYRDPALRQYEPYDLLVRGREITRAAEVLRACGFLPVYPLTPRQDTALRRSRGSAYHHPALGVRLQLHDRVTAAYFPVRLDPSDLWRRRRVLPGAGSLEVPSAEDLLLLTCIHGAFHLWGQLAWVSDLAWQLECEQALDWDALLGRARAAHAERLLLLGLALADQLLESPLPPAVQRRIAHDAEVGALTSAVRARLLEPAGGRTGERLRFRLRVRERLGDRLRYGVGFPLTPTVEDWKALALPDLLFPVYTALRPLRLAASRATATVARRAPFMTTPAVPPSPSRARQRGAADTLYDLGCGDGRIVVTAAQRYGVRAVGVDLDPARIAESRARGRAAGVEHLVTFIQGDALAVDLRAASVVTLWMLQTLNLHLRPKLRAELRPGARIVSHSFDMGDWTPARTRLVPHGGDATIAYL